MQIPCSPVPGKVTYTYERNLQAIYHEISNRGICVDEAQAVQAVAKIDEEITKNLAVCTQQWGIHVFVGKANDPGKDVKSVNLNSSAGEKSLLKALQNIGYVVPKITKKNVEGTYERKYSTGELALQRMLTANQFSHTGGDPAIKAILAVREMGKLKSSYFNARRFRDRYGNNLFLSSYNVAGTLTGRRSSSKHSFGYGNNGQNFPKHGSLAKTFRKCLVARPGNIFLMVDQKSAEEWPVNALAENYDALTEMINGVNRHIKRASFIFGIPETSRTEAEWKDSMEYYLGKKGGHANNYGMQPPRLSDSLAQEGYSFNKTACEFILNKLNLREPNIRAVFHKYVRDCINKNRTLINPFGRECQFLGLRPNDDNYHLFNQAFAQIPQGTVGDNTGLAITYMEHCSNLEVIRRFIVQEGHDSIIQDIPDDLDILANSLFHLNIAFNRDIVFHNKIKVNIPIEAELGYNLGETVKVYDLSYDGLKDAREKLRNKYACPAN